MRTTPRWWPLVFVVAAPLAYPVGHWLGSHQQQWSLMQLVYTVLQAVGAYHVGLSIGTAADRAIKRIKVARL